MRYAAFTLLCALLNTSAVLAQTPQGESPSQSQLRDRAREEEMPVKMQPGSPLRLSVKAYRLTGLDYFQIQASVENVSNRDIGLYSIRRAAAGDERPGNEGWGGSLPDFGRPGKILRPGQADVKQTQAWRPFPSRDFPGSVWALKEE